MKKFSQLGSLLGTLFRVENVWGSTRGQHLQNSAPLICWFSRRNCTEFYAFANFTTSFLL